MALRFSLIRRAKQLSYQCFELARVEGFDHLGIAACCSARYFIRVGAEQANGYAA
jgi:hypothetical protein